MYQASNAFHEAVANGAPQKALLIFDDAIFSNSDIDVDGGMELDDYFNAEEDIAIGQALSNEIRFSLFNDDRLLNSYGFGEFLATVGARIATGTYTLAGNVTVVSGQSTWTGHNSSPYLKLNGSAVSSPPTFPVKSIVIYGWKVYALGGTAGQYKAYTTGGEAATATLNGFMQAKAAKLGGYGVNVDMANRRMVLYRGGKSETYEFVPWGKFVAKRPDAPDVNLISFTCHDFMTKFDRDMPTRQELGINYPCTFGELFAAMCGFVEVSYETAVFINSTAVITSEPEEFENATMREVLQWLAEAAAANLRFSRDGVLRFDWLRETGQALNEQNYSEYVPNWYTTPQIDKLYNRNTASGTDKTVGIGEVGYLIQDNPLLKGVS